MLSFIVFVIAGASDALDGMIAKQFNSVTRLGKYLDPLADKILLVSIYITLGVSGDIPSWLVILVVSRDFLIVGGILFSYLMEIRVKIRPLMISKANTCFQIYLAALILGGAAFNLELGLLGDISVYIVGVTTLLSGYSYIAEWTKQSNNN